ncbi:MAG: ATP-binding protein [Salinivirgaceae bacterium]|nr:ATP-binding protein [Salinivirgaceae bacterium]
MEQNAFILNYLIITGPESTGKTDLAKALSDALKCKWVPEFSRDYIEGLERQYTFEDVEFIARKQMQQFADAQKSNAFIIFDTGLLITKVWFDVVYNKCPNWLIEFIENQPKVFHLLCDIDLPWLADNVRENGGFMRKKLFDIYIKELERFGFPYQIVSGKDQHRIDNALEIIKKQGLDIL